MKKNNTRVLAKDLYVSNDTRETHLNNNDLIIGSSGCGKTGSYVIPNLQNLSGSLVVSDTKRRLEKLFRKDLEARGYEVAVIDLVDPEKSSMGYNPLKLIRRTRDNHVREQDVLTLASTICPEIDPDEPYWDMSARSYIAFLIGFCLEACPEEDHTMRTIVNLHQAFQDRSGRDGIKEWTDAHPGSFISHRFQDCVSLTSSERTWSCIRSFASRSLEWFDFAEADMIFSQPDSFDPAELGKKKMVLFLNVSDLDHTFDPLVIMMYSQILQSLCAEADENEDGRLAVPVRIIMDDFAASAKIPDFDKTISVIRSRGISCSIILQSLTQLESLYPYASAMTIINNCDHIIYMGTQDLKTAEFIASHAFKTPENVMCLPLDKVILITKGQKAVVADKVRPYSTLKGKTVPKKAEEKRKSEEKHVETDNTICI